MVNAFPHGIKGASNGDDEMGSDDEPNNSGNESDEFESFSDMSDGNSSDKDC